MTKDQYPYLSQALKEWNREDEKAIAYEESRRLYKEYKEIREKYVAAEKAWWEAKNKFEALDRKSAMTDGRLKKVTADSNPKPTRQLTLLEIQRVAEALGISIKED